MVVGEPTLMGGEFGDEDERLITRLENSQFEPNGDEEQTPDRQKQSQQQGQQGSGSQFQNSPSWSQDKKPPQPNPTPAEAEVKQE